tara:strand:- start:14313 stop:14471 length:159 start_codon:yes stop_codon:yes gene_type:complete
MRGRVRGKNYAGASKRKELCELHGFNAIYLAFSEVFLTKIMWGLRERIMEIK